MAVETTNNEELELQTIPNERQEISDDSTSSDLSQEGFDPNLLVLEEMVRLEHELGYLPRGWNNHWLNMDTLFELTSSASMSGQKTSETVVQIENTEEEEEDNEPVEKSNSCFWR